MVLTDSMIEQEIYDGNIIIQGFNLEHINPNSYDLTLAPTCKIYNPYAFGSQSIKGIITKEKSEEYLDWADSIINNDDWHLDVKDKKPSVFEFDIPESGFILQPNHLYLYSCRELIGVKHDICATVMGKSSLGRLGLDIHVCAGFIDTGFQGNLVLEMRSIYPLKVYPGMKICQIKYERTEGIPNQSYDQKSGSKYMGQRGVQESKMGENW